MKEREKSFVESILPALVAVLIATVLYRRFGMRVPGLSPAMNVDERVQETLGELNLRELQEGRAPFVLTRAVQAAGVDLGRGGQALGDVALYPGFPNLTR